MSGVAALSLACAACVQNFFLPPSVILPLQSSATCGLISVA